MKCSYCGKNNKEGALYCKRCGIGLPAVPPPPPDQSKAAQGAASVPPEPAGNDPVNQDEKYDWTVKPDTKAERKRRRKRSALLIITLAAVLAVGALAIWYFASTRGEILPSRSGYTLLEGLNEVQSGEAIPGIAAAHRGEIVVPEGETAASADSSLNGSSLGMITGSGKLYLYRNGAETLVANYAAHVVCSADGSHLIYSDTNGLLWSADCKDTESAPVCICNDPVKDDFAVSPDGGSVIFNTRADGKLMLYTNKRITAVADDQSPVSVSNGGKYIYGYSASDNSLYYTGKRARGSTFVRSNITGPVYLNSTHTELVFATDAGEGIIVTMICVNGGEPVQIMSSGAALSPVLTVSGIKRVYDSGEVPVIVCPLKSFERRLFAGPALVVYTRSGSNVLEPNECSSAVASDDYGSVFFVTNGSVIKRSVRGSSDPVKVCEAVSFKMNSNGSRIWFTDSEGALWCRRGSAVERISAAASDYVVRPNNGAALFIREGLVFRCSDGKPQNNFAFPDLKAVSIASDAFGLYGLTPEGWIKLTIGGGKVGRLD